MNKKKFILLFLALCILVANLLLFSGCKYIKPQFEEGFFTYNMYDKNSVSIFGLTESGKQQETIVVPKTLGGYPVKSLGENKGPGFVYGDWESENLKRVYITHEIWIMKSVFSKCKHLKKIIFSGFYTLGVINVAMPLNNQGRFFSKNLYETRFNYENRYVSGSIYIPACVNYYLNYETSEPIYWADDYDNELISFMPPNPIREGYTFGGWYKEADCINAWNFESDKVPAKQYEDGYCYFEETKLYAKWNLKV